MINKNTFGDVNGVLDELEKWNDEGFFSSITLLRKSFREKINSLRHPSPEPQPKPEALTEDGILAVMASAPLNGFQKATVQEMIEAHLGYTRAALQSFDNVREERDEEKGYGETLMRERDAARKERDELQKVVDGAMIVMKRANHALRVAPFSSNQYDEIGIGEFLKAHQSTDKP